MNKNKLQVSILVTILLLQISISFDFSRHSLENRLIIDTIEDDPLTPTVLKSIGAGGEEQLKTNVYRNGDFEDID